MRAEWEYDTVLNGVLTAATRHVDGQAYTTRTETWDAAYRPTKTTLELPDTGPFLSLQSRNITTELEYTADGQTAAITYPAIAATGGTVALGKEKVTTIYDRDSSMPSWMSGGFGWGTYVASSTYDFTGRLALTDLGNTYGAVASYHYDEQNRLSGISLDRERINGTELDLAYTYDQAGNVTSITDTPTNTALAGATSQDNQCFSYDGLARLQTAWTAGNGTCDQDPSAGAMGGAAPYWTNYSYDVLGNRTKQTTTQTDGTQTTTTYAHGAGDAGPHAVTTATTAGVPTAYTYDDAGNQASVEADGVTTGYTWDAEGELTTAGDTSNVYDADGNRIIRTDANGTTIYVGGQEIHIDSEGDVSATRYYSFAGKLVAIRTDRGLGDGVTSIITDHHGTPIAAIPNGGHPHTTPISRLYTDPFGATRGTSTADVIPGDAQFLGKTRDMTGLTQVGARYYDEEVGAFISVDPILDLNDPQQWNAYAYSNSSPVTLSDPTGLRYDDMTGAQWNEYKQTGDVPSTVSSSSGSSGGSGTVDPPVKSGEGSKTPAPDSWWYSYQQDRALGQWPNHYSDKLGICGPWDPGSVCKKGLNAPDVFDRVRADFGELFPPGLMAGIPSDTRLDDVGQVIPTNLKVLGVETGLSGRVVVTDIYDDGFDVASIDGAIDGTVQFRILQEGPSMYLTVNGYYESAPMDVWPWVYNAGSPQLWGFFSANIASKTGVIG